MSRRLTQRFTRFSAIAVIVGAATIGVAAPAFAHDELLNTTIVTNPTDGSAEAIRLTFSNSIIDAGIEIIVTGPNDLDATGGTPEVSGPDVTQKLATDLPVGDYSAAWRVVSSDGHPIEGAFSFSVEADGKPGDVIFERDPRFADKNENTADDASRPTGAEPPSTGLPTAAVVGISTGATLLVAGAVTAIIVGQRRRARAFADTAAQRAETPDPAAATAAATAADTATDFTDPEDDPEENSK